METLETLLEQNRRWSEKLEAAEPGFFKSLSGQQAPEYFWIGCADSRVPANELVGLRPGELFVHRSARSSAWDGLLACGWTLTQPRFRCRRARLARRDLCGRSFAHLAKRLINRLLTTGAEHEHSNNPARVPTSRASRTA